MRWMRWMRLMRYGGIMAKTRVPVWIYGLAGVLLMVIGYRLLPQRAEASQHPTPRAGITAAKVLPASQFATDNDIGRVYAMAKEIPEILDGIYCYCHCSKHFHHRSLLTCYETDHASMCDICM